MPHNEMQDPYLREFFNEQHPLMNYLRRMATKMPLGADIVGGVMARMQALWDMAGRSDMADRLLYAPGDRTVDFGGGSIPARVGLGMPIAYDVWYLFGAGNMLEFGGKDIDDTEAKMADFFTAIDNAAPLLSPETPPTGGAYMLSGGGGSYAGPQDAFGTKQHTIKEARFETWQTGGGASYDSVGPKNRQNDYVGYIAFPVGPLGVMWKVSLASQSSLGNSGRGVNVYPVDASNNVAQGGELLPPFNLEKSQVFGEPVLSKGWLADDDASVELLADAFDGIDNPELHQWLRYWIKPDSTLFIPGEFVGMMCRPWPLHCWWFQETAPFLYAGTWVETEFYASGTVQEVLIPDVDFTPGADEHGNRYKVWVKNEEILIKSSDFFEYEVDEQVGLLKTYRDGGGGAMGGSVGGVSGEEQTANFDWQGLELQDTGDTLNTDWVIVPVGFYESSNGIGGTS